MKNLDNGKINDYENKKKEKKEMSVGIFIQYYLYISIKKLCIYQFVRYQYKKIILYEFLIFNI